MSKQTLVEYLQEYSARCTAEEQEKIAQDRKDEGNLCRIRKNIYEIFETLWNVSEKQAQSQGTEAVYESFEQKAEKIPAQWKASYEKAKEHQDVEQILVEEEKLAVSRQVMDFYKTWKEEQS